MSITYRNSARTGPANSKGYPSNVDQEDCQALVIRSIITMAMVRLRMYQRRRVCTILTVTMDLALLPAILMAMAWSISMSQTIRRLISFTTITATARSK